jgi:hypothetical protein
MMNGEEKVDKKQKSISEAKSEKINHRKLPQTNLRKNLLEIMKLHFVHLWHLFLSKRFSKL